MREVVAIAIAITIVTLIVICVNIHSDLGSSEKALTRVGHRLGAKAPITALAQCRRRDNFMINKERSRTTRECGAESRGMTLRTCRTLYYEMEPLGANGYSGHSCKDWRIGTAIRNG